MQYMLLINTDDAAWESMTDDQRAAGIELYRAFTEELSSSGALVAGDQLMPASSAKQVRAQNGKALVTDGPFAETKETLGGYYLIEAASEQNALDWAAKCPGAQHGVVEVRGVVG